MGSGVASFLPRIQSIFYALFDDRQGPKVVYQVPEGLINDPHSNLLGQSQYELYQYSLHPLHVMPSAQEHDGLGSTDFQAPATTASLNRSTSRSAYSRHRSSISASKTLFNFEDISRYVIPPPDLCGKLVICTAQNYRIMGCPVNLEGPYERNYFRYNVCFVFKRSADSSCYEPIVRKVSRVLTACEEESAILSGPQHPRTIPAVLEQLYEDLNSYSETSIELANANFIDLKIFPIFPNPPEVQDWGVPIALLSVSRRIDPNRDDITVAKEIKSFPPLQIQCLLMNNVQICQFIDGVNHVKKIAHLADCRLDLARKAIAHLLYYQVVAMVDIFQYSNIYALRKSIQWLGDDAFLKEECGTYVTKPGHQVPDWPKLLQWYSRFKPGKTVYEWMNEHGIDDAVDIRCFTLFGVVKGFLQRVHRWPILLPPDPLQNGSPSSRTRGKTFSSMSSTLLDPLPPSMLSDTLLSGFRQEPFRQDFTVGTDPKGPVQDSSNPDDSPPATRSSVAETVLEKLHNLDIQQSGTRSFRRPSQTDSREASDAQRNSLAISMSPSGSTLIPAPSRGPSMLASAYIATPIPAKPRPRRSDSTATTIRDASLPSALAPVPPNFAELLDGEHNADELATRFEVGWQTLQRWLATVGGGKGGDDLGRVSIIYR